MAAAAIPLITTGISALAGLFGGRPKVTKTTSDQTSTTTPNLTPFQMNLMNLFGAGLSDQARADSDLSGYTASGLRQINSQGDAASLTARNMLASRGLSYSPYAGFVNMQQDLNRRNQSADFLNQIPLLQRQLRNEDFTNLMKAFSIIPTGQTSTGHSEQTQTGSGNMLAGGLAGLGAGLAGPFGSSGKSNIQQIADVFGGRG